MAQNEIQKYTFSAVPTAGSWKPVYDGEASLLPIDYADIASGNGTVRLQSITAIGSGNAAGSGDYNSGFTFEFIGEKGNADMLTLSYQDNTLTIPGGVTFGTTQEGGGGNNEVQTIVLDADGGAFTILIPGYGTTSILNWNDDANTIAGAIASAVGGGVSISFSGSGGSYSFEFQGGLADTDIPQMSFGTNSLTKAVSISVSVLQEGVPVSVSLSSSSNTMAETGGSVEVYATSDAVHALDITASLTFSGTAIKDTDYSSSADAIVISNGQTSGSITLTSIGDASVESNESIVVDIDTVTNGTENGTQQITITLVDDDGVTSTLTIAAFCEDHNQMEEFQINQSSRPITFPMRHSATGMLVTGATVTTRLSKNGGAYAAAAGATGEMTLGSYSIAPNATDFNTGGSLKLIATAANCLTTYKEMVVVNHSPITGFPTGAVGAANGALVGSGTGTVVLTSGGATYSVDAAGVNIATASSIPTLSGIASTVAANVPTNAQIASTVAANVPTNAQIAATVAANLPTNASIASTVAAAVPTNASIASTVAAVVPTNTSIAATVAAAITADHGSGNYATATALAAAQSSINTLATTSQLASSSATLLAAIPSISTLATTSQLAESSAALLTQVNLAIATSAAILDDTGTSGVVVATASKTGYALASDGLDSISTTAPSGVATNFRQMVVQTWRRLFKKTTLTSTQLKTYADDGTTVVTTQAVTNSGGIETVGNAS